MGSTERGYGYKWQKVRERFLRENPLCERCRREGYVKAADLIDHKVPHRGDETLFWDESNWEAMCTTHHSRDKQREEAGRSVREIGLDGWPRDNEVSK